eukprot:4485644-Prymnesium_polylepis.1
MGSARATLCGGQAAVGIGAALGDDGGEGAFGYSGTPASTGSGRAVCTLIPAPLHQPRPTPPQALTALPLSMHHLSTASLVSARQMSLEA